MNKTKRKKSETRKQANIDQSVTMNTGPCIQISLIHLYAVDLLQIGEQSTLVWYKFFKAS